MEAHVLIYLDFPNIDEMHCNTLGTLLSTSLFSRLTTPSVYNVDKRNLHNNIHTILYKTRLKTLMYRK